MKYTNANNNNNTNDNNTNDNTTNNNKNSNNNRINPFMTTGQAGSVFPWRKKKMPKLKLDIGGPFVPCAWQLSHKFLQWVVVKLPQDTSRSCPLGQEVMSYVPVDWPPASAALLGAIYWGLFIELRVH